MMTPEWSLFVSFIRRNHLTERTSNDYAERTFNENLSNLNLDKKSHLTDVLLPTIRLFIRITQSGMTVDAEIGSCYF